MVEVVQLVVSAVLQILLTFWVIRRDDRRLTGLSYSRGFPISTLWIAVVVFGPFSIPIHFVRTRRSWTGLGLGLAWLFATLAALALAGFLLALILE
jgi:hypothetical protein